MHMPPLSLYFPFQLSCVTSALSSLVVVSFFFFVFDCLMAPMRLDFIPPIISFFSVPPLLLRWLSLRCCRFAGTAGVGCFFAFVFLLLFVFSFFARGFPFFPSLLCAVFSNLYCFRFVVVSVPCLFFIPFPSPMNHRPQPFSLSTSLACACACLCVCVCTTASVDFFFDELRSSFLAPLRPSCLKTQVAVDLQPSSFSFPSVFFFCVNASLAALGTRACVCVSVLTSADLSARSGDVGEGRKKRRVHDMEVVAY